MRALSSSPVLTSRGSLANARALARAPRAASNASRGRDLAAITRAGWFENDKDKAGRDTTWEAQQEILRKRRRGVNVESEISSRRKKVSGFLKGTLSKEETEAINKKNRDKANELSKEAFKGQKGWISIPGMAICMPEFDGGERFDLRGPYADEGWVDPDDEGISNPFKGLFGGGKKKKEEEKPKPKPKKKGFFGR